VHARSVVTAAIDGVTGELVQARLTPSHEQPDRAELKAVSSCAMAAWDAQADQSSRK